MKLCYIILAHENIKSIARLIERLTCEDTVFVVHIDKKCSENLNPLENISNVKLIQKFDIKWGGISQVEALNYCCEVALKEDADYFVLLSGSDYPVKSAKYINSYFCKYRNVNFIGGKCIPSADSSWAEGGRRRTECYALVLKRAVATIEPRKMNFNNFREIIKVVLSKSNYLNALKIFLSYPKRKNTIGMQLYGGEFWWRLRRDSLERITNYRLSHPDYHKWQIDTANCDELYYNTLVYNLCNNNSSNILTFINWGGVNHHPLIG